MIFCMLCAKIIENGANINFKDTDGGLHFILLVQEDTLKLLIQKGSEINLKENWLWS